MSKLDLTGQKYGRLTVIEDAGRTKGGEVLWKCQCDCGQICVVRSADLRNSHTTSCGCFKRDTHTKHGLYSHPLYNVWCGMMRRTGVWKCANDNDRRDYIERGISVCEEWQHFENFYDWALSNGYEKGLQIDRTDNGGDYDPANCRWVTSRQNNNNRRCTLMLCGCSLALLCSELGIETFADGKTTKVYDRISHHHLRHKGTKVHRDLVFSMARDIEKQEQLLEEIRSKRKQAEAELERLKALFKS